MGRVNIDRLTKVIAKAMYEVSNEGTWSKLSKKKKKLWLLDAGNVVEELIREGFVK